MAGINWHTLQISDNIAAAIIILWRVARYAPRVLALLLVPLLKFIASNTGKYALNDYLSHKYPPKRAKNGRSSSAG